MFTETLIRELASQSLLGLLLAITLIGYYFKDKKVCELQQQICDLHEKRLQDILTWKDEIVKITEKVNQTLDMLTNLIKGGR